MPSVSLAIYSVVFSFFQKRCELNIEQYRTATVDSCVQALSTNGLGL